MIPTMAARGAVRGMGGMVLPPERLAPFAGTDRLRASGMPRGELRSELRRIPQARNALTVAGCWVQTFGMLVGVDALVRRTGWWPLWAVGFLLMARGMSMFNILGHEAAHRLLFRNHALNDAVGIWLCSVPGFNPMRAYRRVHMAHHKDEFGPDEPDLPLYTGYPISPDSLRRKLVRDATGSSGVKIVRGLLGGLRKPRSRRGIVEVLVGHAVLAVVLGVLIGWWAWPLVWFAPWLTLWRVFNRLRAIAEHGGLHRSEDKRETTHMVRVGWMARFWFVPYHVGDHLAHHVDMGVPMWNLPRLTRELEAAGHITPSMTYPTYRALWKALSAGSPARSPVPSPA